MKTHNLWIYHCECCGNVVVQEPENAPPRCCDRGMTQAAARTVPDEPTRECGCGERGGDASFAVNKPR
jgi:hypothetical protein